jgi:hypothetical protein
VVVMVVVLKGVVRKDERKMVFRMRVVMVAGETGVLVVSGRLVASTIKVAASCSCPCPCPRQQGLDCTTIAFFTHWLCFVMELHISCVAMSKEFCTSTVHFLSC